MPPFLFMGLFSSIKNAFSGIVDLGKAILNETGEAIFGTETIYSVGVVSVSLMDKPPETIKASILEAVMANDLDNITDYLQQATLYNLGTQADRYKRACTNYLPSSIPMGQLKTNVGDSDAIKQAFYDGFYSGIGINILEIYFGELEPRFLAYVHLRDNYGWNTRTNIAYGVTVRSDNTGNYYANNVLFYDAQFIYDSEINTVRIFFQDPDRGMQLVYRDVYIPKNNYRNMHYMGRYTIDLKYNPFISPNTISQVLIGIYNTHTTITLVPVMITEPVVDSEGNPVLDEEGNQVYQEVQETDENGDPVFEEVVETDWEAVTIEVVSYANGNQLTLRQLGFAGVWSESEIQSKLNEFNLSLTTNDSYYDKDYTFIYDTTTNLYPSLTNTATSTSIGSFYPAITLKSNFVDITDDTSSSNYINTVRALRKFGMTPEKLLESINDSDSNPNKDSTAEVFFSLSVDLLDTNHTVIKYLSTLFVQLEAVTLAGKSEYDYWLAQEQAKLTSDAAFGVNRVDIKAGSYNIILTYNYIDVETISGSLNNPRSFIDNISPIELVTGRDGDGRATNKAFIVQSRFVIEVPISDVSYRRVTVHGLAHTSDVNNRGFFTVSLDSLYTEENYKTAFHIPLEESIYSSFTPIEKEVIISRSMKLIIYAIDKRELDWYETELFGKVLQIVLFVVAAITMQPQIAAIGAAASIYGAILVIGKILIYGYIIGLSFEALVSELGLENSLWIAIAALALSAYSGPNGSAGLAALGLPSAQMLMGISTQMISAIQNVLKDDFTEVSNKQRELYSTYEDQMAEIEEAWDDIGSGNNLLNYTSGLGGLNIRDTPNVFYERTVNMGNPGVLSLDAIDKFVDTNLDLPENINYRM